jgi:alpha-tubulin suppressor-like RCC1 family protein
MAGTTRKGVWDLQQVRDQYLAGEWEQQNQLWSWGYNDQGQLGQNNRTNYSSPIQIPGTSWSSIAAGFRSKFSLATKTDGTLWSWGYNNSGRLGQNTTTNVSSPVQIPGNTWSSISSGYNFSLSTKTDGTLWSWGYNDQGQLGQNNRTYYSSPVQIPGTTWSSISAGSNHSLSTKTDGTLWSWGDNLYGGLGQNNRTDSSSPVQIPGNTWSSIVGGFGDLATKTDGTLWSWGFNYFGELGQNNRTYYSSPVQIPGTTWSSIDSSSQHTLATKTDGTLWAWGKNNKGQLGQNNVTYRSSPVQIPGTTWSSIAAGFRSSGGFSLATKTDGTLWGWGDNNIGQIAQNTSSVVYYSSPIQIPGTQWSSISAGNQHTIAIKSLVN